MEAADGVELVAQDAAKPPAEAADGSPEAPVSQEQAGDAEDVYYGIEDITGKVTVVILRSFVAQGRTAEHDMQSATAARTLLCRGCGG